MLFAESIVPYEGTTSIKLRMSISEVKNLLREEGIHFKEEIWSSQEETVPNPWNVIIISNTMSLFFAKNRKLFKIVFWQDYTGSLPNGIKTGLKTDDALKIDPSLAFDDWNEDYESSDGYWLEDDIENGCIMSISIFIKELLDDDLFDTCNW